MAFKLSELGQTAQQENGNVIDWNFISDNNVLWKVCKYVFWVDSVENYWQTTYFFNFYNHQNLGDLLKLGGY